MYPYDGMPDLSNVDVAHNTIEQVAHNLPGSSGLGGVDSQAVTHRHLDFGTASEPLRHSLANFTNWLATNIPPWAAHRAMWEGRLLALDNAGS
jgi:hypothetical protein